MPNAASLFRLINELIIMLLGALLILVAVTRGVALPVRPSALIVLGVLLIYWGIRARLRRDAGDASLSRNIRSGSLLLTGVLVAAIPLLPLKHSAALLALAGGILVVRGLIEAVVFARRRATNAPR